MAPLEGITTANVYKAIGVFSFLLALGLGLSSLYLGFTQSPDDLIFGIDDDILKGLSWLLIAVFWALLYHRIESHEAATAE